MRIYSRSSTKIFFTFALAGIAAWSLSAEAQTAYTSTDTPLNIPAVGSSGPMDTSIITVPGSASSIQDVDIVLDASHTFSGDLEITVTSPQGTSVLVHDNDGGSADLGGVYTLDDSGAVLLGDGLGSPIASGTYLPFELLSAFNGENPVGDWMLDILDTLGGDSGVLNEWQVIITSAGIVAVRSTPAPRVYEVINYAAINSATYRALPMAMVQRQAVMGAARAAARDVNARLLRARAETGSGAPPRGAGLDSEPVQYVMAETDFARPSVSESALSDRVKVFVTGDFNLQDINTMGDVIGSKSETWAGSGGLELQASEAVTLGLGVTGIDSETEVSEDVGTVDITGGNISPYATLIKDSFYADVLYSFGTYENDIARKTGMGSTAKASPDSITHNLALNVGHGFSVGSIVTGPLAGLDYLNGEVDGYTERGGGSASVRVDDQTFDSLISRLGWQASCPLDTPVGAATAQVWGSWNHEFLDDSETVRASLLESPFMRFRGRTGTSFGNFTAESRTEELSRDYLGLGAGIMLPLGETARLSLNYEGLLLRKDYSSHSGSVQLSCAL